jgi:FKBP-type peptidyl-prolyl cis-trans isomerase FkpA
MNRIFRIRLLKSFAAVTITTILSAGSHAADTPPKASEKPLTASMLPMLVNDLVIHDTLEGSGEGAKTGQALSVHYTGWLYDAARPDGKGKKFDSSLDRGQRFNINLGVSRVIEGWTKGLEGMKVGGKRTLIIPARMGYGDAGAGGAIPPKAPLLFEIELFSINGK